MLNTLTQVKYNPDMKLTREQVKKVAQLANLPISEDEEDLYTKQLSAVLEYVDQLNSVNTNDVSPTFNVSGNVNVFHKDQTIAGLTQEEALQNTKSKERGFFKVKRVIGG